ncbi:hypothetical protein JTB14_005373 [Gonioctena quinquepunctata]|nr:hypothetical protein JTB14_005373 [Gonioctena quinquepunctata]
MEFRKPDDAIKEKSRASVSKEDLASIEEQMLSANEFIDENMESMVLTYQELKDFLENVQGSSDPLSVSEQYTIDTHQNDDHGLPVLHGKKNKSGMHKTEKTLDETTTYDSKSSTGRSFGYRQRYIISGYFLEQ